MIASLYNDEKVFISPENEERFEKFVKSACQFHCRKPRLVVFGAAYGPRTQNHRPLPDEIPGLLSPQQNDF
jgi:hypothetical protein